MSDNDLDTAFSFDDPHWRRFPQRKHDELGLVGNELWGNKSAKRGALVCPPSNKSEKIAVSEAGLNYLVAAVQRGDITSGEVVFYEFVDRKQVVTVRMDVLDVFAKVKDVAPRQGKYGPFWLFYKDGTPEDDDDIPF
jgi:hypothetical protein